MDLSKIVPVFFGARASEFRQKHKDAIEKLCSASSAGCAVRDLPTLQSLLDITLQLVADGLDEFSPPACSLIGLLSRPYIRQTTTDELRLNSHLKGVLAAVGRVLEEPFTLQLKICCATMLADFASVYGSRANSSLDPPLAAGQPDLLSPSRTFNLHQSMLNEVGLAAKLALALHAAQLAPASSSALSSVLAAAALQLSAWPGNCQQLAKAGALVPLAALLADAAQRATWPVATETAWNILELHAPARQLPQVEVLLKLAAGDSLSSSSSSSSRSSSAPSSAQRGTGSAGGNNAAEQGEPARGFVEGAQLAIGRSAGSAGSAAAAAVASEGAAIEPVRNGRCQSPSAAKGDGAAPDTEQPTTSVDTASAAEEDAAAAGAQAEPQDPPAELSTSQPDSSRLPQEPDPATSSRQQTPSAAQPSSPPRAPSPAAAPAAPAPMQMQQKHISYSTEQQAQQIVAALCPLYGQLSVPLASQADQELANDLLVVAGYLASGTKDAAVQLLQQGFVAVLLEEAAQLADGLRQGPLHATAASIATLRVFAPKRDEAACQRLQLLWGVLASVAAQEETCEQEFSSSGLIPSLLRYASWTPAANVPITSTSDVSAAASSSSLRWNPDQSTALRSHALSALQRLAAANPAELLACEAVQPLLGLAASRQASASHAEAAVQIVGQLAAGSQELQLVCAEQGAVSDLLRLAADQAGQPEGVRRAALVCLAQVCRDTPANMRLMRHAGGAEVLAALLRSPQLSDPSQPQLLLAAVAAALKSCVLASAKSCARLLVAGGMDALLELLAAGSRLQRPLLLALLADLLQQPGAGDYFHEWCSSAAAGARNAVQLVLDIWREQEQADGLTVGGVLVSTSNPLQLPYVPFDLPRTTSSTRSSPATSPRQPPRPLSPPPLSAAASSLAATLTYQGAPTTAALALAGAPYSTLQPPRQGELAMFVEAAAGRVLMERAHAVLKLAGWQRCRAQLAAADELCSLVLVEQYVRLLQGHVWSSLERGFEGRGLRPTTPDRQRLESGRLNSEALAAAVQQQQRELMARQQRELASAEGRFYASLGQQHQMDAAARHYQPDRSLLSVTERVAAKTRREQMLAASLKGTAQLRPGAGSGDVGVGRAASLPAGAAGALPAVMRRSSSAASGGSLKVAGAGGGGGGGVGRKTGSARSTLSTS